MAADRLVALGMDASGSAGMWTSADGRDWILAPTQTSEPFSGLNAGDLETAGLAARDSSAVAFADDVRSAPRFWAAGAGDAAWSEVEVDPAGFAGATVMAVTADRAGLVAVGFEGDIEIPETWHAAVWNSTDGRDWRRAPDVGEQFDGDIMELVTAGGPGFVAVGSDPKGTHVWTSSDGREWVRDRLHLTSQEGLSLRVVALSSHGPDIAAIGYTDAADAFLLRSSDAATWSETRLPPEIFARMTVRGMVEFDGRLVVVGEDEFGATVWESPDGADWTLLSGAVTAAGSEQPLGLPSMKTRLTHGDPAFAVYLSVAHEPDAPQLETAGERLRAIGYAADPVDVACDRGAQEALGLDPHERYSGIALYFETEADAWQFVQAWKQRFRVGVVGVAEVQTFCAG